MFTFNGNNMEFYRNGEKDGDQTMSMLWALHVGVSSIQAKLKHYFTVITVPLRGRTSTTMTGRHSYKQKQDSSENNTSNEVSTQTIYFPFKINSTTL